MIKHFIREIRPKNWLKNTFVFVPLVFSLTMTVAEKFIATSIAFVAFCLISSSVYIFNDIRDIEVDRQHPVKCTRPIANGVISVKIASIASIIFASSALMFALYVNLLTALIVILYVVENIVYSVWLKQQPILDCFCIAIGFILRIYAGSFASGEPISDWLFLTILSMSLFMAFGKRRGEMLKVEKGSRRTVLEFYKLSFLDGILFCTAGCAIVFYSLWAMDREKFMIYTVPVIIFIVCKYILLIHDQSSHGDPTTVIFEDRTLLVSFVFYSALVVILLYAGLR